MGCWLTVRGIRIGYATAIGAHVCVSKVPRKGGHPPRFGVRGCASSADTDDMLHHARLRRAPAPVRAGGAYAGLNIENLRRMSGVGWAAVLVLVQLMVPFYPPNEAIGWAGWVVGAALLAIPAAAWPGWPATPRRATLNVLLASCYYGVAPSPLRNGWPAAGRLPTGSCTCR